MKTIVRVFPDYQSTGLWYGPGPGGANMCESEVAHVIPEHMLIALKYWHHIWEFCIGDDYKSTMSGRYEAQWNADGQSLVDAMNACQDEFEFIYSPY